MDIFYCIIRRRLFQELNYLYILSPQKEKPKKTAPRRRAAFACVRTENQIDPLSFFTANLSKNPLSAEICFLTSPSEGAP